MELDENLSELEAHLEHPDFRDMAKGFEERLRQTRELRPEQRQVIWQRYQGLWDRRKAWSEGRKRASEAAAERCTELLNDLEAHLENPDFRDFAKGFEERLHQTRELRHDQREVIWQRYQGLWDRRKALSEARKQASEAAMERYLDQLLGLDFTYDGLPVFQTFSNFERVGEKIRATREILKGFSSAVTNDSSLVAADRKKVFTAIDDVRLKVGLSEETTFFVHGERAAELYNDAYRAVDSLPPRDATPIFKAAQAELNALWLPRVERDKYHNWFSSLWATLQAKREEGRQRYENWRARQEQGVQCLEAALAKAEGALERVRENNCQNHDRLGDARSDDWRDVVSGWIQEGEEKERDIENSIEELREKIRDARFRVQQ